MLKALIMCLFLVSSSQSIQSSWFGNLFKDVTTESIKMPEVTQDDKNVIVTMYIPNGIESDDINVEIKDKTLYVSGAGKSSTEVREEGYYHSAISSSSFNRAVSLPCLVDELGTIAEMNEGVLVITMPKIPNEEIITKKIKVIKK